LGCGTGTNAITLARHGWTVTGVDFSPKAIRAARRKAAQAGLEIDFRVADVQDMQGIAGPYDFALDIGCLHSLQPTNRERYADHLARLLCTGGRYMLYAWVAGTRRGKNRGITQEKVAALFAPEFKLMRTVIGEDRGAQSAWHWLTRE
jgi:cyclopropane fatty-acyl-phospholipid synthase-like methyltransferase